MTAPTSDMRWERHETSAPYCCSSDFAGLNCSPASSRQALATDAEMTPHGKSLSRRSRSEASRRSRTQFLPQLSVAPRRRFRLFNLPQMPLRHKVSRHQTCFDRRMHGPPKKIVYIIRNDRDPSRHYTGITNDLHRRLERHNFGRYGTVASDPWSVVVSMEFPSEQKARAFEVT